MIREIMRDQLFLAMKSVPATKDDLPVAQDLLETLIAHKDGCVGMAANMIGVHKRIIVFDNEGTYMTMFNPEIVKKIKKLGHFNDKCNDEIAIAITKILSSTTNETRISATIKKSS